MVFAISVSLTVLNEIAGAPEIPAPGLHYYFKQPPHRILLRAAAPGFRRARESHTKCIGAKRPRALAAQSKCAICLRMSDVPFDKSFDLVPGHAKQVAPGVRALVANNPGPFTYKGTVSYIIGSGKVAILDPGPDDDAHIGALLDAVRGETVTHIFVTHTHRDHSPAVPKVKTATGAKVFAEGPHRLARPLHIGETRRLDASADMDFAPDVKLADGDVVSGDGWTMEAVTTAGHTANHMAYAFKEADLLFAGDHVMAWSTTIVAPPDGAMTDYMASLQKLARRSEPIYLPGHGAPVRDAQRYVQFLIKHRQGREASILHRLGKGAADIPTIVKAVYIGLDPRLVGAAALSTLAHMEDLVARGIIATDGPPSIEGTYRLADRPLRSGG